MSMDERFLDCAIPDTYEQRKRANGWQPIETAPKDDTTALLWNGGVFLGWWDGTGWQDRADHSESGDPAYPEPTHWMPAPASPQRLPGLVLGQPHDEKLPWLARPQLPHGTHPARAGHV